MLSNEEKKELLEDAKNMKRSTDFRMGKTRSSRAKSIDEYLRFLDNMQTMFTSFDIPTHSTITKFNKL